MNESVVLNDEVLGYRNAELEEERTPYTPRDHQPYLLDMVVIEGSPRAGLESLGFTWTHDPQCRLPSHFDHGHGQNG